MEITIVKATAADAAEILEYLKQIGAETDNLSFGGEGLPFSVEAEAKYIEQISDSKDDVMFIAKADGRIVGSASLNRLPRRMSHRGDFSVSVRKAYWNKGIGSKLIDSILAFAEHNSFEIIDLQVRSDNLHAIHLYSKYGFRKLCTYPAFSKVNKIAVDYDIMYLQL